MDRTEILELKKVADRAFILSRKCDQWTGKRGIEWKRLVHEESLAIDEMLIACSSGKLSALCRRLIELESRTTPNDKDSGETT